MNLRKRTLSGSVVASLLLGLALTAACPRSAMADAATCHADKWRAVSRAIHSVLACRIRAVVGNVAPEPACHEALDNALAAEFAEAQAGGGCAAAGEGGDVANGLHALDEDLASLLFTNSEGTRCAVAKIRASESRARFEVRCRRSAARAGVAVAPDCYARAQARLASVFAKRDSRGLCSTTADAPAAEQFVADYLAFAESRLDGSTPPPAPSGLSAVIDGAEVELAWMAPDPGSGLTVARVLRRLGAAPSDADDPASTVVFEGAGAAAIDAVGDLLPDTTTQARTYHYAVYGCDEHGACEDNGSHATLVPTLTQVLKVGGYTLHWRHASADVCSDQTGLGTAETTSSPDWWKSCDDNCGTATARQLNATGRTESTAIGDAFAAIGIPVGRVLSSEFCRNVETAMQMDFGPAVEEVQELTYFVYDEPSRCVDTFAMLAEVPALGTNTALIGHAGNSCLPLSGLAWAEAAIYKPDGQGGSTFIARVTAGAWLSLP